MTAVTIDPVRAAAQALRDLSVVPSPCPTLRAYVAEHLRAVPLPRLRVHADDVFDWVERLETGRPTRPTAAELQAWAAALQSTITRGPARCR